MPAKKNTLPVRANCDMQIETTRHEVNIVIDTRKHRIRGLEKDMSLQQLRVNVMASRDDLVHLDTFDLCKAKSRNSFIKATASELFAEEETIKKDIGRLLLALETI